MSNRRKAPESSLELLLDTICNTFGGVLFLAILICVLLRMTTAHISSNATDELATAEESKDFELRLETLLTDMSAMEAALKQQQAFTERFSTPEQKELARQHQKYVEDRDRIVRERLESVAMIQQSQRKTAEVKKAIDDLDGKTRSTSDEIKRRKKELDEAEKANAELAAKADELLKSILASQATTAPLPRQRPTSKLEVGLIVRFNRLYVWHHYDSSGLRQGLNTDEFVVVGEEDGNLITMPKPYAGTSISDKEIQQLVTRLRAFNREDHYFAIVIRPDSFGSFQTLKNTLVGLGFEYRLIPLPEGEKIADRGGTGGKVQ